MKRLVCTVLGTVTLAAASNALALVARVVVLRDARRRNPQMFDGATAAAIVDELVREYQP
jgi:hypothetical protein